MVLRTARQLRGCMLNWWRCNREVIVVTGGREGQIDMAEAHIWDQSGVAVLDQVIRRIKLGGSEVEVINLNDESLNLFSRIGQASEAGGRGGEFKSAH